MLLCLMQTAVCTADTFKGKIVNAETVEILIGATVRSEINPQPGWSMQNSAETDFHYGPLDTTAVRTSNTYEPSIFLKWKMSRVRNMDIAFAYNTTVPDLVSTLGYRNTIDPLHIYMGNPLLRNSHSHTTTYNYHRMWLRKQIVLGLIAAHALRPTGEQPLPLRRRFVQHHAAVQQRGHKRQPASRSVRGVRAAV